MAVTVVLHLDSVDASGRLLSTGVSVVVSNPEQSNVKEPEVVHVEDYQLGGSNGRKDALAQEANAIGSCIEI